MRLPTKFIMRINKDEFQFTLLLWKRETQLYMQHIYWCKTEKILTCSNELTLFHSPRSLQYTPLMMQIVAYHQIHCAAFLSGLWLFLLRGSSTNWNYCVETRNSNQVPSLRKLENAIIYFHSGVREGEYMYEYLNLELSFR